MIKKIEDLDHYEILNLPNDASLKEIENSYVLAIATYSQDGLASYGVLLDEERAIIMNKVEEAFRTLRDPEKRKAYDMLHPNRRLEFREKASFRKSTRHLLIEDASEEGGLWDRIKSVVAPLRPRREHLAAGERRDDRHWQALSEELYYYGDYLKKIREKKGVSLESIAQQCGVELSRLKSLEEENAGHPPNEEQDMEALKCYAKCLGFNGNEGQDYPFTTRFL